MLDFTGKGTAFNAVCVAQNMKNLSIAFNKTILRRIFEMAI